MVACLSHGSAWAEDALTPLGPPDVDTSKPVTPAEARPVDDKGIVSIVWENDVFANRDNNYTNGFRMAWLSPEYSGEDRFNDVAGYLFPFSPNGKRRLSLAIGQSMFTPDNLKSTAYIPGDRPYAGWLYGSVGAVSDTGKQLDNVVLTVGMVGPSSQAEAVQKFVHEAIGSQDPKGWDNQLHDELGVNLTYEHKWRGMYQFSPFGLGLDATPSVGVNLGNVNTDASAGMMFRLGYDLPSDYGPPRIRPSLPGSDFFVPTKELGGYLFAGFEGRAVARNIFLDGNTFEDSHSVDKENLIGSVQAGIAVTYGDARLSYTHVFMTKEFKTQDEASQFGAVTLSYRF
ncbi:DUF2219 family protein [bacterium]|nr:DUF2219 family protein [bacterium]